MALDDLTRRTALGLAAAFAGPSVVASPASVEPGRATSRPLTRIAFGSCAHQAKDQPIWDAVLATRPDLFIFLGDNIYADTRDPAVMSAKYAALAAKPGFRRLRDTTPMLAVWDDHDYGEDDGGADYPMKAQSRALFCDFWGVAADSPRRRRDGIYEAYVLGPEGRRVQVILPDLRWNRTPVVKRDLAGVEYKAWSAAKAARGEAVPGPYERNPDPAATMLGEPQWRWLEAQLRRPADLRLLGSSLQVLADFAGWESWANYARDQARLFATISSARAERLICLSGDTHYGEVSYQDVNTPYPLWDITSSGLTETWDLTPPNALRRGAVWHGRNFGLLEIDWRPGGAVVEAQVRDEMGQVRMSQRIDTAQLILDGPSPSPLTSIVS